MEVAFVDEGYTGEDAEQAAKAAGIDLIVAQLLEAKKDFVLLLRRRVVERSFAWNTLLKRCVAFISWPLPFLCYRR
jgi:hypothetical protein